MTGTLDNGALCGAPDAQRNGRSRRHRILDYGGVEIGSCGESKRQLALHPERAAGGIAHIFTAVATDPAKRSGQPSDGFTLNIDAQAPDVPVITSVIDDNNQPTVPVLPGQSTATIGGNTERNWRTLARQSPFLITVRRLARLR